MPPSERIDPTQFGVYFSIQCAIIKGMHPTWSTARVFWAAAGEMIHLTLDGIGLIPGAGEIADLTNGLIYTIEGNGTDATLSYASAIPIAGWFAAGIKIAKKTITIGTTGTTALKWVVKTGNLINFGDRAQLRKVLNLATGDARQAHHILPWGKQAHPVIQRAAKAADAFHMNEPFNGIALSNTLHMGSHTHYDNLIVSKLQEFITLYPNATPVQCKNQITLIINDVRTAIQNNPGVHINQLIF